MLRTEMRNEKTMHLDQMSPEEICRAMNYENMVSVRAVEAVLPQVARAIDAIAAAFFRGGRLFYIGAGTSGRLAVVDAAECPPTFGAEPGQVVGIIAGGAKKQYLSDKLKHAYQIAAGYIVNTNEDGEATFNGGKYIGHTFSKNYFCFLLLKKCYLFCCFMVIFVCCVVVTKNPHRIPFNCLTKLPSRHV